MSLSFLRRREAEFNGACRNTLWRVIDRQWAHFVALLPLLSFPLSRSLYLSMMLPVRSAPSEGTKKSSAHLLRKTWRYQPCFYRCRTCGCHSIYHLLLLNEIIVSLPLSCCIRDKCVIKRTIEEHEKEYILLAIVNSKERFSFSKYIAY